MFDCMNIEFARSLIFSSVILSEAVLRWCSYKKGVLNIYSIFTGEHPFQSVKSHFDMRVPLLICCIFSEHLSLGTPPEGWVCSLNLTQSTQDVSWTYIRRSEDVLDVFWTSYVRSIYVLCRLGRHHMNVKFWFFWGDSANFLLCFVKCERQKSIFFLSIRKDNSILLRVVDLFKFLK